MAIESREPSPIDYAAPTARGRMARWMIVTGAGAVIALLGVVAFLAAPEPAIPVTEGNAAERAVHVALWGAFGITLLAVGGLLAAVGLMSWCRQNAG